MSLLLSVHPVVFGVFACCSVAKSTVFFLRNWSSLGQCLSNNLVGFITHTWQPAKQTRFVEGEQEFQGECVPENSVPCFPLTAHAQLLYEKHYVMISPREASQRFSTGVERSEGGRKRKLFQEKTETRHYLGTGCILCVSLSCRIYMEMSHSAWKKTRSAWKKKIAFLCIFLSVGRGRALLACLFAAVSADTFRTSVISSGTDFGKEVYG